MYTIQTNASGTRSMEISEENLQTIEKYALFQHLIDRKSTRLNSSHVSESRMPSSA